LPDTGCQAPICPENQLSSRTVICRRLVDAVIFPAGDAAEKNLVRRISENQTFCCYCSRSALFVRFTKTERFCTPEIHQGISGILKSNQNGNGWEHAQIFAGDFTKVLAGA
jgi:hypothetical protein